MIEDKVKKILEQPVDWVSGDKGMGIHTYLTEPFQRKLAKEICQLSCLNRPDREKIAKKIWERDYEPNYPYRHGWGVADPMIVNICREKADQILALIPDMGELYRDIEKMFPWIKQGVNTKPWQSLKDKYPGRSK